MKVAPSFKAHRNYAAKIDQQHSQFRIVTYSDLVFVWKMLLLKGWYKTQPITIRDYETSSTTCPPGTSTCTLPTASWVAGTSGICFALSRTSHIILHSRALQKAKQSAIATRLSFDLAWATSNTICYNVWKSNFVNVQICSQLQLVLVQVVQICTCFLLHCVLLYVQETAASNPKFA